jgi:DNA mismatch endonuclease (patch repair protein)
MKRDIENREKLVSTGWKVLRFWEREIKKDIEHCIEVIEEAMNK